MYKNITYLSLSLSTNISFLALNSATYLPMNGERYAETL
jgi:hypothetical protein